MKGQHANDPLQAYRPAKFRATASSLDLEPVAVEYLKDAGAMRLRLRDRSRVKTGKARNEHKISGSPPKADIPGSARL
jgi:hypothetical protein